jgi:3-(3-hydroxy-phenyl)propionate hydroxylase
MLANLLGGYGLTVKVVEAGDELIDYPRGVGMDDETLRTFQAVGLVDDVLPHTIPHQLLVFVDRKGKDLARIAPPMGDFGWPRRNGFVQPLADRVLLDGLERFPHVDVLLSTTAKSLRQDRHGVDVRVTSAEGDRTIRARFAVGADGGRSAVRKSLGIGFRGTTSSANWLVIDIRNDPLGHPGAYVGADPGRPFASISIPHGIRRFEFMLKKGETEADAERPAFVAELLAPFVPRGTQIDIIRRRVYSHHSRMAESFRSGRVFLVGDAAHVMPVWQGQGYNSGIRDSFNLAWKLAMAVREHAGESLLASYELERREHVRAMIQLSTWVGRFVSVTNRPAAAARDTLFRAMSLIPPLKRYIVQMRFKPMPTMHRGAITRQGATPTDTAIGRIFPQPRVVTRDDAVPHRLDEAIGTWFALVAWNNDPREILSPDVVLLAERAGIRLVEARPAVQLSWHPHGRTTGTDVIGDVDGTLKKWFDTRAESVVLIRPDRIVAAASPAHAASGMMRAFSQTIGFRARPLSPVRHEPYRKVDS